MGSLANYISGASAEERGFGYADTNVISLFYDMENLLQGAGLFIAAPASQLLTIK